MMMTMIEDGELMIESEVSVVEKEDTVTVRPSKRALEVNRVFSVLLGGKPARTEPNKSNTHVRWLYGAGLFSCGKVD